jgi:hypothetical protein
MLKFKSYNQWLNEYHNDLENIIVLYPGSFKPITGGHLSLIERYASSDIVKEIKVLVGAGIRNGITQDKAIEIISIFLNDIPKVSVEAVKYPSPIMTAYKYLETAVNGNYALASSKKDDDYNRVIKLTNEHKPGGRYYNPKINVIEMPIDVNPLLYNGRTDELNGTPVSASILRKDVLNNDFNNFTTNYPSQSIRDIQKVWDLLHGQLSEDVDYNFRDELFEGGNAFENTRNVNKEELLGTYKLIEKEISKILKLSKEDFFPIGSFGLKKENELYGDIDIAIDYTKLNNEDKNPLDYVYEELTKNGLNCVKMPGFQQISIQYPIYGRNTNGFVQVDLMFSKNLKWSKYAYSSPDFSKGESKYKAEYASFLIMSIITESFKKVTKKINNEIEEYSLLSYRLNSGLFEVVKSYMGKKGLTKTAKIIEEKFISDDPEYINDLAFGEKNVKRSFEEFWKRTVDPNFIHRDKLDLILSKFKFYLDSANKPYPSESIQDFPEVFSSELKESFGKKLNTHMMHIEELLFEGEEGLDIIKEYLENLNNKLLNKESNLIISTKIDGAPAVMAWSKFPGLKNYGLGTKTVFNKEPITCHNVEDVEEKFGDRPDLAKKLLLLLEYLKEIEIPENEIWHGDFLFDYGSLNKQTIEGKEYYTFKPNTIKYAVEVDSDIGKEISNCDVGIIWHTRYLGENIKSIDPVFDIDLSKLNKVDGIYMSEPYIKTINLQNIDDEKIELQDIFSKLDFLYNNDEYQNVINYGVFNSLFQKFHNTLLRSGNKLNPSEFNNSFLNFVKNERGDKYQNKIEDFMKNNESAISIIVDLIEKITNVKNKFLKKLNQLATYKTYVDLKSKETKSVNQEGFAISFPSKGVVKIVDRSEFFYLNTNPDVLKGWQKNVS